MNVQSTRSSCASPGSPRIEWSAGFAGWRWLLTLDQLSRAAGFVCALELERLRDTARLGAGPFEIGLWVGKAGTPNHLGVKRDGRAVVARST